MPPSVYFDRSLLLNQDFAFSYGVQIFMINYQQYVVLSALLKLNSPLSRIRKINYGFQDAIIVYVQPKQHGSGIRMH